jgi:D-methionine transport system permease protein
MFSKAVMQMIGEGIIETLYMTFLSSLIAYIIGLPIGILLVITDKGGIAPCVIFNRILGVLVNILRSVPFVILLVAVIQLQGSSSEHQLDPLLL